MNCKLVFADGTELDNLTVDNNVFASQTEVAAEMLNEEALASVTVIPTEGEEYMLRYAKTDTIYRVGDEWHFALVGASAEEIRMRELREDMETALNELLDFVIGGVEV